MVRTVSKSQKEGFSKLPKVSSLHYHAFLWLAIPFWKLVHWNWPKCHFALLSFFLSFFHSSLFRRASASIVRATQPSFLIDQLLLVWTSASRNISAISLKKNFYRALPVGVIWRNWQFCFISLLFTAVCSWILHSWVFSKLTRHFVIL